ncbi:MAG TPA: cation transporter [Vicinamibacterales bacterium]|jgi:copper chaperone CopZ|nr:cation transporter [Vicinamibacterales bacterium]
MKTFGVLAAVVLVIGAVLVRSGATQTPDKPATQVCALKVSGMTCAGCEAAVRMAARSIDGVTDAKVSHAKGNAEVTFDPSKTNPDAIAKVITEKSGFKAEPVRPSAKKPGA